METFGTNEIEQPGRWQKLIILNDRSLMIQDLPTAVGVLPEGRSPRHSRCLNESIRQQISIWRDRSTVEIFSLPSVFWRRVDTSIC
jgi:hypothetical protein